MAGLSFTTPLILLALASLPLLWLLLRAMPQMPKKRIFPGTFFIRELKDQKQTPSRTPWWLLLLRLIALGLAILALAGPVKNALSISGNSSPMVVVIDDSWPAASGWRDRQKALATIAAEATRDKRNVWVVTTTPQAPGHEEAAISGPLTGDDLSRLAQSIAPRPYAADRAQVAQHLSNLEQRLEKKADIFWLSDDTTTDNGLSSPSFVRALKALGEITVWRDASNHTLALGPVNYTGDQLQIPLLAAEPSPDDRFITLALTASDGRFLAEVEATLPADALRIAVPLDLPLMMRNEIALVRLSSVDQTSQASAGAIQLVDASARRVRVGLAQGEDFGSGTLLQGAYYIRQALAPFALFSGGSIDQLIANGTDVIVLDDVGRLRLTDVATLEHWVDEGGILLRFAGPNLADNVIDGASQPPLLPVPMRGGGRAFGGALTWETPQKIGDFAADSPFADLIADPEIEIRRQVLAKPGTQTATRSWAYLGDGTPLVTAKTQEQGLIVLFHVPATPGWSDLPISGVFVDMLRRIITLAPGGLSRADADATYAPLRVLDGYGRFQRPAGGARPAPAKAATTPGTPLAPPGFYGSPDTPLAINAITSETNLISLKSTGAYDGLASRSFAGDPPRELAPWLFLIAAMLVALDTLIALFLQGRLLPSRKIAATIIALVAVPLLTPTETLAQPRAPIDQAALKTATNMRFGHILTGNNNVDRLVKAGLDGLSYELERRTAVSPDEAVGVNLETDDLNVFPLLYWPVSESTDIPSELALGRLERFMASGGLLIIDTSDGDRAPTGQLSPEGSTLRLILEQMNIPPLEPLPKGHVLGKSFYLLRDLPGRNNGGPIWVEARSALSASNGNDGVTPIIIGGRDWAAAWARDNNGLPMRPMGSRQGFTRETAFRSGINMAMIALTGNYKEDQVHVTELLKKLGAE